VTDPEWYEKVWVNIIRRPDHNAEANPDVARAVISMLTQAAELNPTPPHKTVVAYMPDDPAEYIGDVIDYLVALIAGAGTSDTTNLQQLALQIESQLANGSDDE